MTNSATIISPNKTKKILGQPVKIPRLGVGDKIRLNKHKYGTVVAREPNDPKTMKGGSITIAWKGTKDPLTYKFDDYGEMEVIWIGEEPTS